MIGRRSRPRLARESLETRRCLASFGFVSHVVDDTEYSGPVAVTPADLDKDGDLDLLVSARNQDGWYENLTGGEPPVFHPLASPPRRVGGTPSVSDLDGDDDLDILIVGETGGAYRYENLGSRVFSGAFDVFEDNYRRRQLSLSDVDGDGLPDLVTTEQFCMVEACSDVVGWHANQGDGTFARNRTAITAQQNVDSLHLVDLNGDQHDDLVLGNAFCSPISATCTYRTTWYPNLGEGEFGRRPIEIHRQPISEFRLTSDTFWRDVDNDGDVDGVIAADYSGRIVWIENIDGQGDFSDPQIVASWSGHATYSRFAVGDLDGDNDIDVVASDERGRIFHRRFDGERKAFGGWRSVTSSFADTVQLSVADVDGDLDGDVIAVSTDRNRVAWFESLSDSAFALPVEVGRTLNRIEAARAVDLDRDGDQDFLVAVSDGLQATIQWYENSDNAAGRSFVRRFIRAAQTRAAPVDAGDIDSDGDVDLLVPTASSLIWLVNDGSQEFGSPIALSRSQDTYETRVVDFDGDGDLDVVGMAPGSISWYENVEGQGAFERHEVLGDLQGVRPHTIADYDADGDIDIIVRTTCSGVCTLDYRVLRNNDGQFEARTIFRQSPAVSDLSTGVFGDLDGDRDLDMVFHDLSGSLTVYTNGREGSLRANQVIVSTTQLTPDLADIDADGDLDIVGYHQNRTSSVWYENLANNAEFSDDQPLIEFESTRRDVVFADWDSDGDVDLMTYTRSPSNIRWLENRPVGDVNGDGVFDSSDLVDVFQQGKYDDGVPRNASFVEGDWNGDGEFDASDLTAAFQWGGYQ